MVSRPKGVKVGMVVWRRHPKGEKKKSSNQIPVVGKTKQKNPTGLEIIKILGYTEKKTTVARSDEERRFLGDRSSW